MRFIRKHLEWIVFSTGLILLGIMSPENAGSSFCFFEFIGIDFCPGEGLGHSIAYSFRGDLSSAMEAHIAGPAAIIILSSRIVYVWRNLYNQSKLTTKKEQHG